MNSTGSPKNSFLETGCLEGVCPPKDSAHSLRKYVHIVVAELHIKW